MRKLIRSFALAGAGALTLTAACGEPERPGAPAAEVAAKVGAALAERAKAAGIFAETLLRIPEVIGFDEQQNSPSSATCILPSGVSPGGASRTCTSSE